MGFSAEPASRDRDSTGSIVRSLLRTTSLGPQAIAIGTRAFSCGAFAHSKIASLFIPMALWYRIFPCMQTFPLLSGGAGTEGDGDGFRGRK
jgi:hypothetical protein